MNKKIYALSVTMFALFALTASLVFAVGSNSGGGGSSYKGNSEKDAVKYYDRGMKYVEDNDYVKAVRMFRIAVSKKKDHTEAYNMLGFSLRKSGRYEEAIKNYKKALKINPDFPEAHEYIGEAYLSKGNRDLAWMHYTELKRLESEEADELLEKINEFDIK